MLQQQPPEEKMSRNTRDHRQIPQDPRQQPNGAQLPPVPGGGNKYINKYMTG